MAKDEPAIPVHPLDIAYSIEIEAPPEDLSGLTYISPNGREPRGTVGDAPPITKTKENMMPHKHGNFGNSGWRDARILDKAAKVNEQIQEANGEATPSETKITKAAPKPARLTAEAWSQSHIKCPPGPLQEDDDLQWIGYGHGV